ncbi:cytochrome b561 domain-containing protein At2g30890-like [Arachis ipaensis]|uniref:cytochrome b561 domain-containing protein At2g30890-like n=1 Tax=Arachis ipaensis TaxID=130454 RepID=UPI0007AFA757|nr:cytochrome b561 domain-containing protein At2g30890-like [Arachis ipaensis]XP_025669026.1 cytochrome b561 domain-containing protein At2g30890 [Arachis hypogaea]QHN91110.1 Cytochrome b561 domain-containing protein [Arachis hypogaea]
MGNDTQSSEWKMFIFSTKERGIRVQQKLIDLLFQASLVFIMFPLVGSEQDHKKISGIHASNNRGHNIKHMKMNPRLEFEIKLHGFLLWSSMAFLMPLGIVAIRFSNRQRNQRRLRITFYVHAILQKAAVLIATAGAIMSIKNFNNSFNNNHQRLGLALYGVVWLQVIVGIFRPQRGSRTRSMWFFAHWIIGTAMSLLGVINVYLGLQAYQEKTSRSITTWNILFTVQISLIVFFYLVQEKWDYIRKQGVALGNELLDLDPSLQEIGSDNKKGFKAESV